MSNNEMEDLGCLPHGAHLYRKRNDAGGWTYYSDECGVISIVWDTCTTNESTVMSAILCEHHRRYIEFMTNNGWKPPKNIINEKMASTNGLFLDPIKNKSIDGYFIQGSGQMNIESPGDASGVFPKGFNENIL